MNVENRIKRLSQIWTLLDKSPVRVEVHYHQKGFAVEILHAAERSESMTFATLSEALSIAEGEAASELTVELEDKWGVKLFDEKGEPLGQDEDNLIDLIFAMAKSNAEEE